MVKQAQAAVMDRPNFAIDAIGDSDGEEEDDEAEGADDAVMDEVEAFLKAHGDDDEGLKGKEKKEAEGESHAVDIANMEICSRLRQSDRECQGDAVSGDIPVFMIMMHRVVRTFRGCHWGRVRVSAQQVTRISVTYRSWLTASGRRGDGGAADLVSICPTAYLSGIVTGDSRIHCPTVSVRHSSSRIVGRGGTSSASLWTKRGPRDVAEVMNNGVARERSSVRQR